MPENLGLLQYMYIFCDKTHLIARHEFVFQVNEASEIRNTDIAKELSLPPVKLHCSSKCVLQSYNNRLRGGGWVIESH